MLSSSSPAISTPMTLLRIQSKGVSYSPTFSTTHSGRPSFLRPDLPCKLLLGRWSGSFSPESTDYHRIGNIYALNKFGEQDPSCLLSADDKDSSERYFTRVNWSWTFRDRDWLTLDEAKGRLSQDRIIEPGMSSCIPGGMDSASRRVQDPES